MAGNWRGGGGEGGWLYPNGRELGKGGEKGDGHTQIAGKLGGGGGGRKGMVIPKWQGIWGVGG